MTIWTPEDEQRAQAKAARKTATNQAIKALIDQGSRRPVASQPNRATRRRHRTR